MNNKTLLEIATQLEYDFDDIRILRQAFTRKSYSEEHNGEHHNEVLEFYGDKALEFVVMKKLSEYYGNATQNGKYASEKTEGQLTEIKKKLVCKKMLAHRIDTFGFADYILMGKGDIGQSAQNQDSVKEDLFEAIVGAVAIDSGWDAEALEDVIDRMLDIEHYLEKEFSDDENYVDLIQTWCQKRYSWIPEYDFDETEDGWECSLSLSDDCDDFIGRGYSKREARMNAAQNAYEYLEENDELLLPIDEVGEPDIDRAINQLQELYQKGYIDEPYYEFNEDHDENGNPTWRCECHIKGADEYYWINSSSKKNGKNVLRTICCAMFLSGVIEMKLRELREQKGVTQKEVANAVGCTPTVYSRYEREEREPDIATLCSLADYFRVSVDSVIGYSNKQKNKN